MKIRNKRQEGLTVVFPEGNIVAGEIAEMQQLVIPFVEDDSSGGIILNLQGVDYIDSSGLGLIVSIYKTLKKSDKKFAITNSDKNIRELFVLTKLDSIFTITEDVDTAFLKLK